ncbi:uncharacterized protein TNCV_4342181 [Trichonephila clavipes]|nr:uncharacterized protein TNCV_4342181 [Trichonephila clavipes]
MEKNLSSRMIRWALKLSEFNIEWEHRPGVQNVVAHLLSRNPLGNIDESQISCAALRALAFNSREQLIRAQRVDLELGHIYRYLENPDDGSVKATICEGPYRVLEVWNNNLIVLKKGKRVTVNSDQVRVYRPRQSDTISSDSHLETLYEGQRSSNRSNRSQPGKFKGSNKTSSEESKGHKSSKGNAGWEDPRLKRDSSETLSVLPTQPSKTTRRISRGAEEQRNRKYPTEQHQEKEPQYESLRRRSSGQERIKDKEKYQVVSFLSFLLSNK